MTEENNENIDLILSSAAEKTVVPEKTYRRLSGIIREFAGEASRRERSFSIKPGMLKSALYAALIIILAGAAIIFSIPREKKAENAYFKCLVTEYTDESSSDWKSRRLIVRASNGEKEYIDIYLVK